MSRHLLVLAVAAAGVLGAQDPPSRAGRISYISGTVSFEPAGVDNWVPAAVNRPLTMGDQLYADSGARAAVHVPGTAFLLGDQTAFEFLNLDDRTVQVRLSEGTLDVRVRQLYGNLEVDTPNVAFTVSGPGEYRLDVNPNSGQTLITDRDGEGQVAAGGGSFTLHMNQQAVVMGEGQSAQYKVNPAPGFDAFDRWVMARNSRDDRYAHSGYVSPQTVGYEDLGEYGTWRATPDYGDVWVPKGVSAGWAPYQDGYWSWVDPWGWTWVDAEPWGFAPFHYGRWAFVNGYWGWCPGPVAVAPVYAPALVAWLGFGGGVGVSIGIGGPAVGWFPLGPRDVYIPAFTASVAYVARLNIADSRIINAGYVNNVYGSYMRTRSIPVSSYMNRTVAGAVTVVPQNAFVNARPVRQAALHIAPNQIAAIRTADPAPHVAPQVASVLGRPAEGNVSHPAAAILSRGVVSRIAPPPRPAAFAQRQAALERNPGRPLAGGQLHELAGRAAPAAVRPIVTGRPAVESPARTATHVHRVPAPHAQAHVQTAHHAAPPAVPRKQTLQAMHRPPAPPRALPHVQAPPPGRPEHH